MFSKISPVSVPQARTVEAMSCELLDLELLKRNSKTIIPVIALYQRSASSREYKNNMETLFLLLESNKHCAS